MRPVKTIIFSVLILLVTQIAWGQNHDPFAPERNDPLKSVKIFPNPATDYLSVKFETPSAKNVKMTLHNIIGNILELESEIVDDYEIRIRVKELPAGVYLLAVRDASNSQSSFKFLKR